jgi:hypothetical protein
VARADHERMRTALLALPLLAACSATSRVSFTTGTGASAGTGGSDTSTGTGGTSTGTGGTSTGSDGGIMIDAGPIPDASMAPAEVFGQSAGTLYKVDPVTNVVTTVGDFQVCDSVIDIALDKNGNMYATTSSGFYSVDKATAVCTHIADGAYPNSLSFVPAGTVDPNVEALVGYEGAEYVRIDLTSGAVTTIGSLGNAGYASSGDVVSVIGGGTYLTVNGNGCNDCIVEVNPTTGALVKNIGKLAYSEVYGLAFWGGSAYGFSATGPVFQINLTTAACTDIPIPNMPAGYPWYGAGSTTAAPLTSQN